MTLGNVSVLNQYCFIFHPQLSKRLFQLVNMHAKFSMWQWNWIYLIKQVVFFFQILETLGLFLLLC